MLEVEREGGGELLVPLVRDAVRSVDVAARRIDVDLAFLGESRTRRGGRRRSEVSVQIDVFTLFPQWFDWFRAQRHVANALALGHRAASASTTATTRR